MSVRLALLAVLLVGVAGAVVPAGVALGEPLGAAAVPVVAEPAAAPDPEPEPEPEPEPAEPAEPEPAEPAEPQPEPQPSPEPSPGPGPTPSPGPSPTTPAPPATTPTTDPAAEAAARAEAERQEAARKAAERARKEAAEAARKRAEAAAKAAARRAADEVEARETWLRHGSPHRMLVVRSSGVDAVEDGRLGTQRAVGSAVTLASLQRAAPKGWVTVTPEAAVISAAIVLTPGTSLELSGVPVIGLSGGDTPADAASIYTGGGRLTVRDTTLRSVRLGTTDAMDPAPGRPFVVVAGSGQLDAVNATFSNLGALPDDPDGRTGVQFNPGSRGSLVSTTMVRNTTGLFLSGTQNVRLDGLTVAESAGDGLVLQGDRGTVLQNVRAERNGANGVLVKGDSSDRPITGISTQGNGAFGLAVVGQVAPRILAVTTTADRNGGLRINRSADAVVADYTSVDQPLAMFTHVGTTNLLVQRAHISGGRRGLVIEKSTTGVTVEDSSVTGARVVGVSIGGKQVALTRFTVQDTGTAVRVERGSSGITATGLRISGGEDGVVANAGSANVVLRDLAAEGVANDAVRTASPDTSIEQVRVVGADTGIVAQARTAVRDVTMAEVEVGLRSRGPGPFAVERSVIDAFAVGIDSGPRGRVALRDSTVHALEAVRGQVDLLGTNDVSLPPLNLVAAVGLPLVGLAVLLELVHAVRQRRFTRPWRRGRPPVPLASAP